MAHSISVNCGRLVNSWWSDRIPSRRLRDGGAQSQALFAAGGNSRSIGQRRGAMQARRLRSRSSISAKVRTSSCHERCDLTDDSENPLPIFHPEFGRFMLEATPGKPWGIGFKDLLDVEHNMRRRLVSASPYGYPLFMSFQA